VADDSQRCMFHDENSRGFERLCTVGLAIVSFHETLFLMFEKVLSMFRTYTSNIVRPIRGSAVIFRSHGRRHNSQKLNSLFVCRLRTIR